MKLVPVDTGGEPPFWLIVFNREAGCRTCSWLAFGEFKHVRAIAVVGDAWVFYDVHLGRTQISVLKGDAAASLMVCWLTRAAVLRVRPKGIRPWRLRPLCCTTAIAHLLGLKGALRPDAFYRECLAAGAEPVENFYAGAGIQATAPRSADHAATAAGADAGA